jgi:hypothetical protein
VFSDDLIRLILEAVALKSGPTSVVTALNYICAWFENPQEDLEGYEMLIDLSLEARELLESPQEARIEIFFDQTEKVATKLKQRGL